MSQETINYETKINDLKKAMKEILNTSINLLQICVNSKMFIPKLKPIFTRYNISEMQFIDYIIHILMYIKRILKAQGKNFNLSSSTMIDLISENNLLQPIIEFFISNVFNINDPNEISNIQQQIISELNQQKFESQDIFPLKQGLFSPIMVGFLDVDIMNEVFEQNYPHNTNFDSEKYKLAFIFGDRQETGSEANLFENTVEMYGRNPLENSNSSLHPTSLNFSDNKSNINDLFDSTPEPKEVGLEIKNSNLFTINEPNRNQTIEQQIEQLKNDVAIRSAMQDISKLLTLIKMLNDMRDKLSEVFSPQTIKNVINFLEDILKNNSEEINSVCNIIHEFDEINSINVVHFLHNFSKHDPLLMNENFDFEKLVNFINNELLKKPICSRKNVSERRFYFSNLKEAIKYNLSFLQHMYLFEKFLNGIEKISNKTIEEILEPLEPYKFEFVYVTQIFNSDNLNKLRNELIIPGKDYPMERTQDDLNSEGIAKFDNELWNLQYQDKILSPKEYICISQYCESMVNNSEIEKINHVCSLISNSLNGIDRTLVDSLLDLASLFQLKEIFFHIPSGLVNDFITFWASNYDMNIKFLNEIEVSSKFQPILNLAEALSNYHGKLLNYFSNEQIINLINFIGDICEKNKINEINSIINMIKEFDDINDISNIIHFLHNFSRRYPEVMGTEPIPKSEIDKSEIEH